MDAVKKSEELPVLQVSGLKTEFPTPRGIVHAVRGIDFTLEKGDILAIVGESGCGKSASLLSIMRLIPHPGRIVEGSIKFEGKELLRFSKAEMRGVRGKDMAMVFQDPMTTLNPAYRVGEQISESLQVHGLLSGFPKRLLRREREKERAKVMELLRQVGIPSPEHRHLEYPYQFSGGMQQRILIAIALACRPKIILADEPTTALDVTVQAQVLDLMQEINEEFGTSIILVTHDLGVAAEFCDKAAVMYAGQIVESGNIEDVLSSPLHPYTQGLLRSIPQIGQRNELIPIEGDVPDLTDLSPGCSFAPRCRDAYSYCNNIEPPLIVLDNGREVRCHLHM
ncbi:MAG: ABC transporter ATP-binding protein [Firmicutes bacterium]|jgi:oligopeptide/dipeptide ABC transporter ATP-binding protein|nr:ABC transporter ATP-binding protein [Bacillota bacterium]